MATTNRHWLMMGALVLGAIAVVIVGTGCSVFDLRAATATSPVTRGATATATPASAITATPSARPTKPVIAIPKDQATCLAQGGRWERIGIAPYEQCNLPAPDAGRVCNDSSECAGLCLANLSPEEQERVRRQGTPIQTSGKCSNWVIVVGCVAVVENGQVKNILCLD
jgi:hypothetical protein